MTEPSTEQPTPQGWDVRCAVLYKANVTYRYHRKRQRFFDLLDKSTKAATVLLGASLLGSMLKDEVPMVASAISSLGLLALVFGYGDRKQVHKELSETAMQLVGKIEEVPAWNLTHSMVGTWAAELAKLNAKEPPSLDTLVMICEWEQSTADGHPGNVPLPNFFRRAIAAWVP